MAQLLKPKDSDGFGQQVSRSPRLSDKVADAMLQTILQRGLRPGDQLPSERELGEQYGVSRTVIREAVRALTTRGLVDARAGRGLTVAQVDAEAVSTSMRLYLHGQDEIPYSKIHEVRAAIEIQIAGYAAERATEAEIAELRQIHESMRKHEKDREKHSLIDVEFHRGLVRMTHNELFLIRRATFKLPNDATRAYREHNRIVQAVAAHDPQAAREAMRSHLKNAVRDWTKLGDVRLSRTAAAARKSSPPS